MTYPLLFLLANDVVSVSVQSDGTLLVSLKDGQIQGTFNQYIHKRGALTLRDLVDAKL